MHQSRALFGAAVVNHGSQRLIAVVAGLHTVDGVSTFLRSTEVYDLDTGRWRTLEAQLPRAKVSLISATESDDSVLAIGGATITNGVVTVTADVLALKLTGPDDSG